METGDGERKWRGGGEEGKEAGSKRWRGEVGSRQSYKMLHVMWMPPKEFSAAVLLSLPYTYKIRFVFGGSLVKYPLKFACKRSEPVLSLSRATPELTTNSESQGQGISTAATKTMATSALLRELDMQHPR